MRTYTVERFRPPYPNRTTFWRARRGNMHTDEALRDTMSPNMTHYLVIDARNQADAIRLARIYHNV